MIVNIFYADRRNRSHASSKFVRKWPKMGPTASISRWATPDRHSCAQAAICEAQRYVCAPVSRLRSRSIPVGLVQCTPPGIATGLSDQTHTCGQLALMSYRQTGLPVSRRSKRAIVKCNLSMPPESIGPPPSYTTTWDTIPAHTSGYSRKGPALPISARRMAQHESNAAASNDER